MDDSALFPEPDRPMPEIIQGDARALPLADESVDLIVTSPPYFGLRDYGVAGQLGAEPTPAEFIAALIECTAEMMRVLKPSGSIFVNLGDKYAGPASASRGRGTGRGPRVTSNGPPRGFRDKSLMMLPERYRIAAVDELGLIARAVIVWAKPNGLPESVTDRVRRSHEDWVHLTKHPRYFSAVDEIREPHSDHFKRYAPTGMGGSATARDESRKDVDGLSRPMAVNPLGKLPGSVWTIPTQPLRVPAELGIDHFAAFPMEWPRRIIRGWCPGEVCTACGEGRRPVSVRDRFPLQRVHNGHTTAVPGAPEGRSSVPHGSTTTITGYACACPDTTAPATPGVVLDPFSGTGTTALVATMLGRRGVGVELNPDYVRLAEWRAADPKQRAKAAGVPVKPYAVKAA